MRALEIIEKHTGSDASDICRPAMGMPKQNASPWISDRYAAALMGRANNLFKERRDQRRFTETMEIERLYTRVLAIVERTHGPDHPFIAAARSALTALHSFVEQAPTVTSLDDEWRQEVAALTAKGQEILGVEPGADPAAAAYSVDQRICELSERPESDSTNDKVAIAVAYGDAIARVTGWQWNLYLEKRDTSLAVVSPDAKYVLLPVDFIGRQLAATREVTALLLFNMLAAGHYPAARPGDLDVIG